MPLTYTWDLVYAKAGVISASHVSSYRVWIYELVLIKHYCEQVNFSQVKSQWEKETTQVKWRHYYDRVANHRNSVMS